MVLEHKVIKLFGKTLFQKVVLTPPFKQPNPMPNEACFLYVIEGKYHSISEREKLNIGSNESVLMKCGHYLSRILNTTNSKRYESIAIHFHPDILHKVYNGHLPESLTRLVHPLSSSMAKVANSQFISQYIESIQSYFDYPTLVDEDLLILKLKELILLLSKTENAANIQQVLHNLFNPITHTMHEIIEAHCYTQISVQELASLNCMSLSTFKRIFQEKYQESPATYLKKRKIAKASYLLSQTKLRISDIAFQCGFTGIVHFSTFFKKVTGISPSIYRLNQKGN